VDDKLGEADDLDWKEFLPNGRSPGTDAEFAKDVAAFANTRGGLIVYGVSDDVEFTGIDPSVVNEQQYAQWVRNLVQPYLSGLELYALPSRDGSDAVFVVDVPASELAPHSVAFVDIRERDKARSQRASVTPYRMGSHTDWMAEHQVARAYAERLTRAADWQAEFDELRDWTAESVEGRGGPGTAWLILVARPTRPVPRTAPRLDGETAKAIVDNAASRPVAPSQLGVLEYLAGQLSYVTVGLDSWVVTNRAREGRQSRRESYVELHHDGSLVFTVNLSQFALPQGEAPPSGGGIIKTGVVEQACADLEALVIQVLRALRIDSPMRVQASVASEGQLPVVPVPRGWDVFGDSPALPRLRQVTVEMPAGATEEETKPAAAELAAGILNQFGLVCQLPRYAPQNRAEDGVCS
jgi:hypothetical protein